MFNHSLDYRIAGTIRSSRVIGSTTHIGSRKVQTIHGEAVLTKTEDAYLRSYIMRVDEDTYWFTPDNAPGDLTINTQSGFRALPLSSAGEVYAVNNHEIQIGDLVNPYLPFVIDGSIRLLPESEQIWASMIKTDPGNRGRHKLTSIAAYGSGPYQVNDPNYDPLFSWWYVDRGFIDKGREYVGNYFEVEQRLTTTGGSLRRFINLSSPFSYANIYERLYVTGSAEIVDYFDMTSIPKGYDGITLNWWDLGNLHLF